MVFFLRLFCITTTLFQVACATHRVIRDREYELSVNAYRSGDPELALEKFPKAESGGFITSVEKSWLNVWSNRFDAQPLQNQVAHFDERKYISVTREAEYFLLQEAEEGYVPSEPEVTLLHLLSATHFIQLHQNEEALVELRQAGYVLDHYWDDPALRIWLASLWAATGHWSEAQVDFRRANELQANPEARKLAEGAPPKEISLHFYGEAPNMKWLEGFYTPEFAQVSDEPIEIPLRASTLRWFKRHEHRNSSLRETLIKSNFMAQYLGSKALTETERGFNKSATWALRLTAVAVGVGITGGAIYVMSQIGKEAVDESLKYVAAAGLGTAAAIWGYARNLDRELEESLQENDRRKQEDLRIYRVVRFLPGWIALRTAADKGTTKSKTVELNSAKLGTRVLLINHF